MFSLGDVEASAGSSLALRVASSGGTVGLAIAGPPWDSLSDIMLLIPLSDCLLAVDASGLEGSAEVMTGCGRVVCSG